MDLDQEFLAVDAMLARLNAAMASADAEARHASALEGRLRRILDTLDLEGRGPIFPSDLPPETSAWGRKPAGRSGAPRNAGAARAGGAVPVRVAPGRLHRFLRLREGASAQHP